MQIKFYGLMVLIFLLVAGCQSGSYVKSEVKGTAKPEGEIQENVPPSKTYRASPQALRRATLEVLDEQGYVYEENPSTGTIKTEPKLLTDTSKFRLLGAYYSARVFIKLDGQKITYTARFDKKSNITMAEQNVEYPEKENELRREFFNSLDSKLQSVALEPGDKASPPKSPVAGKSTSVKDSPKPTKDESMTIAHVQKKLLELGYKPGPIDGVMGKKTRDALIKFQKDNNLPGTGKPDRETILKLRSQKQ